MLLSPLITAFGIAAGGVDVAQNSHAPGRLSREDRPLPLSMIVLLGTAMFLGVASDILNTECETASARS
ncbi:MAG: hypothetical protein H7A53_06110 [Akkermansiaceae bacterium]|nr:hypothetical protein [Akkermansiaceae bacterium]